MSQPTRKPCSINLSGPFSELAPTKSEEAEGKPLCTHSTVDGRRCRLPVLDTRAGLCFRHVGLRQARRHVPDPETVASELLGDIDAFTTADEVNLLLGNLIKQLARKRIARRDAIALAYISQLLLNSLTVMAKEHVAARAEQEHREFLQVLFKPRPASSPSQPPSRPQSSNQPSSQSMTQPHKERSTPPDEPINVLGKPS